MLEIISVKMSSRKFSVAKPFSVSVSKNKAQTHSLEDLLDIYAM